MPRHTRILNLSTVNNIDFSFLEKGLNFIPTSRDINQILERNLRSLLLNLQNYSDRSSYRINPFKKFNHNKISSILPNNLFIDSHMKLFNTHVKQCYEDNLSAFERKALNLSFDNSGLIIKPADKGSLIVIQNRDDYKQECLRQLQDSRFYKKLSQPYYPTTSKMISRCVDSMLQCGDISLELSKQLLPPMNARPRIFYTLPKVHKPQSKWPLKTIPPGRPIVSDINSESYSASKFIDIYLEPLTKHIPSFVRDSDHVISQLSEKLFPPDCILFTIDIESLYTNIPIDSGLAAIRRMFELHPDIHRLSHGILKLLEINLRRNDFLFDGSFYLQICGTAMGKSFAPNYASIFLHFWEYDFINSRSLKPQFWKRYIDDIYGVWTHGLESLKCFMNDLNNFYNCINLTFTYSLTNVDFLDITVFKPHDFHSTHKFKTKIFFKETYTGHLIHKNSLHPNRLKISVIKSQFHRVLRKCSYKSDFDAVVVKISNVLISQGYNKRFLRSLKYEVLAASGYFSRSVLSLGFFSCNSCNFCSKSLPSTFAFDNYFRQYRILSFISCDSRFVIFSVYCSLCGPISIQYSKLSLTLTIDKLFSKILSFSPDSLSSHFYLPNHSPDNFYFQGLQTFSHPLPDFYPSKAIFRWVTRLKTFQLPGLDSCIFYPPSFRYIVPFSISNNRHSFYVRKTLSERFNVKISSGFSSLPSFKKILCKSKF